MLCAPSVTDRKWWFFIKCDTAEVLSSFPVSPRYIFMRIRNHISPLQHQGSTANTISAFYREVIFFFLQFARSRCFRKIKKFIVSFFIDLVFSDCPLRQLGCASAKFISWNNNLLRWKHVRRLCSHIAYLVLVPRRRHIRLTAAWVFRCRFWHLNRPRALDVLPRKREAHQTHQQGAAKTRVSIYRACDRRSNASVFDKFIIAAPFKSISCVRSLWLFFFLLLRIWVFLSRFSMSGVNIGKG